MSSKVYDFLETYQVDYEGINFGSGSDSLPEGLANAMLDWLEAWDPRQLRLTVIHTPETSVEMSVQTYAVDRAYYRAQELKLRYGERIGTQVSIAWTDFKFGWLPLSLK